jgi:hypothetical protein
MSSPKVKGFEIVYLMTIFHSRRIYWRCCENNLDSELFLKAHRLLNHIREFVLYTFPNYKDSVRAGEHLVEAQRYKPEDREVIRIYHWHNPSGRTMALGSTRTENRCLGHVSPKGKSGRCIKLITLPPSYVDCLEILGASTFWRPKDLYNPVQG